MPYARFLTSLAFAAALLPGSARATSFVDPEPHDPAKACPAVRELVADLNAGKPYGREGFTGRLYHTDELGFVAPEEEPALVKSLREQNGKPDSKPIWIGGLWRLGGNRDEALYLVQFRRETWRLVTYQGDGLGEQMAVDYPHWEEDTSYWLIEFSSNQIETVREAFELNLLAGKRNRVKGCED